MIDLKNKTIVGPHNHPLSIDSANTVETFIYDNAVEFERKALAVTDHGTLGAILHAHEYSKKLKKDNNINIDIIPGVELYLLPDENDYMWQKWLESGKETKTGRPNKNKMPYYHVTVHFNSFEAYLKGCELSKPAHDRAVVKAGEIKPLNTWEELESLSGQITLFSSCLVGSVSKPLINGFKEQSEYNFQRLMNIAGKGRFFAEIFPYEVSKNWDKKTQSFQPIENECCPSGKLQVEANEWVMHLSKKYNVPMVISEDAHYAKEEYKIIQDCRLGNYKSSFKMADANCVHSTEWLYNEMKRLHNIEDKTFEEMMDNSWKFHDLSKDFNPEFSHSLPKFDVLPEIRKRDDLSEDDKLVAHTIKLVQKRGRIDLSNEKYKSRLNHEIQQLAYNGELNILPYFLVLCWIIETAEENDLLVGPARGSAAGSLLSYGLGITSVDPIKEELSFERFFDVSRVKDGLADIDIDFSDRNKMVDLIKTKWGDKFAYLGIGTTFKTKSAIKDLDRFFNGKVRKETEDVCKKINHSPQGVKEDDFLRGHTDKEGNHVPGELETNSFLMNYLKKNPDITKVLFKMVGIVRQMGRHAAGILIADKPVHEFMPITKVSGEYTTQLMPEWVEHCGGVKYDILGLSTLEDIRLCLKLIKERHNIDIDPWSIEDEDEYWLNIIDNPATVFQLHTETVRPGLKKMRPRTVQEAAALTAIFRPGAMDAPSDEDPNKMMSDIFLERWCGERDIHYIHEDLKPYLESTVGVICFQEQLMAICKELAGLTDTETNKLRKAVSKKSGDVLRKLLDKVKTGLIEKRGWSEEQAEQAVAQMQASGKYSFNKSHSVSYMYVARACAYLKYYYPIEWWTSVLTNASKDDLKGFWRYVSDLVLLLDINESTDEFRIVQRDGKDKILSPLNLIDGIGPAAMNELIDKRPYDSVVDLVNKVNRSVINKSVMIKLLISGSLDSLIDGSENLTEFDKIEMYFNIRAKIEGKKKPEKVPEVYKDLTPLQKYKLMKSVYKVYNKDALGLSKKFLLDENIAKELETHKFLIYNDPDSFNNDGAPIVNISTYKEYMSKKNLDRYLKFGLVGYIDDAKDYNFGAKKDKTMLKLKIDIEDSSINTVMFPPWGENHHGIDRKLKGEVCLFIMSKSQGKDQAYVKKIIPIER